MKALTLLQPWAWAIIYGGKDVENRSWTTRYRGTLAIHTSKRMTAAAYHAAAQFCALRGLTLPPQTALTFGAIIGTVDLVDCLPDDPARRWGMPGQMHWIVANPRPCTPIVMRGALSIWDVDAATQARIGATPTED